jgi:hypothetical protein
MRYIQQQVRPNQNVLALEPPSYRRPSGDGTRVRTLQESGTSDDWHRIEWVGWDGMCNRMVRMDAVVNRSAWSSFERISYLGTYIACPSQSWTKPFTATLTLW